jgi:hypothetical protein
MINSIFWMGYIDFLQIKRVFLSLFTGQLVAIKRMTLSRLFCDNSDDPTNLKLPVNLFRTVSQSNPAVSCLDTFKMPVLDLTPWR